MQETTAYVVADGLKKAFGDFEAVKGISFDVQKGEVLGFLGPNGAGKSTTMKMLTGFLEPTEGQALIKGMPVTAGDVAPRKRIGYLPEGAPLYGDMTVAAFLKFIAECHGFSGAELIVRVRDAADAVSLASVMEKEIETLSKGYKRRVGLAAAILHGPDVLILDEPTDGLDPNQKHEVRSLIKAMSEDRAIIVSTHILEEVEALCSRAIIIAHGQIVLDGTPAELMRQSKYDGALVMLVEQEECGNIISVLSGLDGVDEIEAVQEGDQTRLTVIPKRGVQLSDPVGEVAVQKGWTISQFAVETGRLDDVFRSVTQGGDADDLVHPIDKGDAE